MDFLDNGLVPWKQTWEFIGNSLTAWATWYEWRKPARASMVHIFLLWQGWWGGQWVVGTLGSAWWGWWGWSWAQTRVIIPASLLPDKLYISCWASVTGAWIASYVSVIPNNTANNNVAIAGWWGVWGNAAAWTWGTAGTAGWIGTAATMPLWFAFANVLAWQAWTAWGSGVAWTALTLPVTWLLVTWGTWWGWLVGTAIAWVAWWAFTIPANTFFPPLWTAAWGTGTTTPPGNGCHGVKLTPSRQYSFGWGWWGWTHWGATGAWLVQSQGGRWAYWCGSGGNGWALTGSTAATQSQWGLWYCLITCF